MDPCQAGRPHPLRPQPGPSRARAEEMIGGREAPTRPVGRQHLDDPRSLTHHERSHVVLEEKEKVRVITEKWSGILDRAVPETHTILDFSHCHEV